MNTVALEECRAHLDKYLADAASREVILTREGKPWLVLRAIAAEAADDSTALVHAPEFWAMIRERRHEQAPPLDRSFLTQVQQVIRRSQPPCAFFPMNVRIWLRSPSNLDERGTGATLVSQAICIPSVEAARKVQLCEALEVVWLDDRRNSRPIRQKPALQCGLVRRHGRPFP